MHLAREGKSVLLVYPYWPQQPATVEFIFEEVTDVELADFSRQNVISSLSIEPTVDQNKQEVLRLNLFPCYGLAGRIDAKRIRVNLLPGKSPDGGECLVRGKLVLTDNWQLATGNSF